MGKSFGARQEDKALYTPEGYLDFEEIEPDLRRLLYAGEILHIGKNTRFGFGRYTMVEA